MCVRHVSVAHADIEDARILLVVETEIQRPRNIRGREGVVLAGFLAAGQEGRIGGPASGSDEHLGIEDRAVRQGDSIAFD